MEQKNYNSAEVRRQHIAKLVRKEIMRRPGKAYRLKQLANKYRIDRTTLTSVFRQEYGISIFQFVKEQRLVWAKHLLRNPELPVKVIAGECGYTDVKHFSTVFKSSTGETPTAYRRGNAI
jgi:AraC-like DNA-binding protein